MLFGSFDVTHTKVIKDVYKPTIETDRTITIYALIVVNRTTKTMKDKLWISIVDFSIYF